MRLPLPSLTISFLILAAGFLFAEQPPASTDKSRPNIIFILADDLGIGNVSCYGADYYPTPQIDRLAQEGMRFDHCYSSPLCGPARALLMTGRYAFHTGMTGNNTGSFLKPEKEIMIPAVLKPAGYVTGMCGKWEQLPLEPGDWGFDESLKFEGSGKYWNTQGRTKEYLLNGKPVPLGDGVYLPEKMHEFAVDFITRHKDQPFYFYYSMSHVHGQILPTPDSAPGSKNLYLDNVLYMDKLVGKFLAEIDRLKLTQNTIVIFAGDNGTAAAFCRDDTIHGGKELCGHKGSMNEGGAHVPCLIRWPAKIPAGQVSKNLISFADFLPTFAELANAKLPDKVEIDGKSFFQPLAGQSTTWPRDWVYVQLGNRWYVRDAKWKLNQENEFLDMKNSPYEEPEVDLSSSPEVTGTARKRLETILGQLNPKGGIQAPGDGSGGGGKKHWVEE